MTDAIAPSLRPLAEGQRPGGPFPTRMTALPQQRTSPSLSSLVRFVRLSRRRGWPAAGRRRAVAQDQM